MHLIRTGILFFTALIASLLPLTAQQMEWRRTDGPWGALVTEIAYDASTGEYIVGTFSGNLFYSTDNGVTWEERTKEYGFDYPIEALAVSKTGVIAVGINGDCYHSTDNGASWSNGNRPFDLPSDLSGVMPTKLIYVSDGTLLAATSGGVYRSTDHGVAWQNLGDAFPENVAYDFIERAGTITAIAPTGIYVSTNRGATWKASNGDLPADTPVFSLAELNGLLFAVTMKGVYRSEDSGAHWVAQDTSEFPAGTRVFGILAGTSSLFLQTSSGLYISSNNGATWRLIGTDRYGLAFVHDTMLFAEQSGRLLRYSTASSEWELAQKGIRSTLYQLESFGNDLYAMVHGRIVRSSTSGQTWDTVLIDGRAMSVYTDQSGIYILGFSLLLRSTDNGTTWTDLMPKDLGTGDKVFFSFVDDNGVLCIGVSRQVNNSTLQTIDYYGDIYRSTDGGAGWTQTMSLEGFLPKTLLRMGDTIFLLQSAATYEGGESRIYYSNDRGVTWQPFSTEGIVGQIICIHRIGGRLMAGTYDGVFEYYGGEEAWSRRGLKRLEVHALHADNGVIYAGTNGGVHRSTDAGDSWAEVGLGDYTIFDVTSIGGDIYAGARSGEVFRAASTVSIDAPVTGVAREMGVAMMRDGDALLCRAILPTSGMVSVRIVDLRGRDRGAAFSGHLAAGVHHLPIDETVLEEGAYLCVIRSERGVGTALFNVVKR